MKKFRIILKTIAFSLAIIFILQILPLSTISIAINNSEIVKQTSIENISDNSAEIVGEVESLRDEYTKHFRREDGSFVAAVYNEPVHYLVGNEWKEIDNTIDSYETSTRTISDNKAKYAVTKTSTPITFPENISTEEITINKNGNLVSFSAKSSSLSPVTVATLTDSQKLASSSVITNSSELATESDAPLILNNKNNAITYDNVFENATLGYEVSSSMIKESIVVHERSDNYRYEFNMDFGSFIPREDDSGAIYIYETAQSKAPIMAIAPPYMYDEDNDISYDVTMELIPNGTAYTLVVEADKKWINSLFRDFPVVIDPTVILDVGKSNTYDVHVNQNYPNLNNSLSTDIRIGKDGNDVYRGYIKYNLPDLPDCSVVTDAKLDLVQSVDFSGSNPPYLCVYRCESDWDINSITWNNQPISDLSQATLVDFTDTFDNWGTNYTLEITKIVKDWYENGQNYGLMLASSDESTEGKLSLFSSNSITSNYPVVTVEYVNNTGLEDYWNYESFSVGTNGAAYVNTYNGAFTYIHNDVSTNGLIAPLGISHIYAIDERNASGTFGNMKFGKGFKLNVIEKIEAVTEDIFNDEYSYRLIDADGTVHYFKSSTVNRYNYEYNDNVYLTEGYNSFTLHNPDGSKKHYNIDGYLYQTVDNNNNLITINYSNGRITGVTDGGGKSVTLSYNADNTLNYISDTAGRKTYYTYNSSGYLTQITYPDSSKTYFEYNNTPLLISKITSPDNSKISFGYKTVECNASKKFYRIEDVTLTGTDNSMYDKIEFEYNLGDTYINNSHGDDARITFDNSGRAINILNNKKNVSVAEYHGLSEENPNIANNVKSASNVFTPLENREARSNRAYYYECTDYNNCYRGTSKTVTLNQFSSEKLGVKLTAAPASSYLYTYVAFPKVGKTYTVSAYVNIVDTLAAGSVYLKLVAKDRNNNILQEFKSKEITTTNNQWERIHITATVPENTYNLFAYYGIFDGNGEVYVEDIYSEEADTLNRFNLAKNSSFESNYNTLPFQHWGYTSHGFTYGYGVNPVDGSDALRILGDPDNKWEVTQKINLNGKAGDTIIFGASAWARCSASGNQGNRFFGMKIRFEKGDGTILEEHAFKFNEEAYGTMQTQMFTVTAQQDYDVIEIDLCYHHEINEVLFDDVFVYRDSYGTYYDYDGEGRVTSAYDDNGNKVDYAYTDSNDLSMVTASYDGQTTQTASYTYDSNHNLLTATDNNGVETTYNYPIDNKGLPTSIRVEDSTNQLRTETYYTYSDNYNYLASVIDASGAQTQYTYDTAKGLVTKTTDPNGNETVYEYDPNNDRLLSVSNPTTAAETEFVYNASGQTTQISNSDVAYNLSYDSFGRPTGVNILGTTLSTNSYNADNQLAGTVYGNGDSVEYAYNEDKLLSSVKYDGVLSYEYFYTTQNQVGRLVDHDNDVTWEYFYDMAGRLTDVESDDGKKIEYGYDEKGNPGTFTVKDGTATLTDIGYSYDSQNRPSAVTVNSMTGQPSQSYTYDSLGRIVSYENTTDSANPQNKITRSLSYLTSSGLQTNKIGSVSYSRETENGTAPYVAGYSYEYDDNGNIIKIFDNGAEKVRYTYDALNRLTRDDNAYLNKSIVYTYDKNGDILNKKEYAYTTSTLGTATATKNYEYGDADCPNGLTSYNGEAITYDANGNPLTYRGYTMTWEKGRQLASMSKGGITTTFKYDASGMRTEKTRGNNKTEYTYVGEKLVSMKSGSTVMNFAYGADGSPYSFTYNGTPYFYLLNLQGDVVGIYNISGSIIARYTYDAWGKLISTSTTNSSVALSNPLRYRGYVYDTETGLYYLQSRYYDPETCRFINADSLLVAGDYLQGTNMFAYCLNNPVMYSDLTGKAATLIEMCFYLLEVFFTVKYNVPVYSQGDLNLCWAYCQVMVEDYRNGIVRTQEEADKRAKEIAIEENGKIDWNTGGWPQNTGEELNSINIFSLYFALFDGPLYAYYWNGGEGEAHIVVITGVNLFKMTVYTNNPWGESGEQTYKEFLNGCYGAPSDYDMPLKAVYRIN